MIIGGGVAFIVKCAMWTDVTRQTTDYRRQTADNRRQTTDDTQWHILAHLGLKAG